MFEILFVNIYYSGNYIRKEIRKEWIFYYDGIDVEIGFDKIIDDILLMVGI